MPTVTSTELFTTCPPRQTVELAHGPLSYREAGSGPAVVFLHGLLGNSRSWVKQFAPFSQNHRVIAWDAPGFGLSQAIEPSADEFAETLGALLDALDCPAATIVGHSMGGVVAARLAARRPAMVSALVLSCSHAGYGEAADSPPSARLQGRLQELANLGPVEYGQVRAAGMVAAGASAEVLALAAAIAAETRPEGMIASTRMLQLADNRSLLPDLEMPLMVINGALDPVVRADLKAALLALTPEARHVEIPGVGHAPYLEDAETYNAAIGEFLAARSAA
jgi:pimeloyl-ACP methyl ester carboxylesterase